MAASFDKKVVFITGGGSGIGRATALAFGAAGAAVILADRDEAAGNATASLLEERSVPNCFVPVNVADSDSVGSAVQEGIARVGQIDIAFNNAGTGGLEHPLHQYPEDNWTQVLAVNLSGVFYCMKHQLAHMLPRKSGIIINMASVAGLRGFPWHAAYAASKHGVVGLTKTAAHEYARAGIRINAICPGFTETPMVGRMVADDPGRRAKLEKAIPLGRLASPEEIANAVLFLASADNQFMIGHTLTLDGGITSV
ncbi:MAG: glucose 1-dehydrogenase [Bacteroidota bacterium]